MRADRRVRRGAGQVVWPAAVCLASALVVASHPARAEQPKLAVLPLAGVRLDEAITKILMPS